MTPECLILSELLNREPEPQLDPFEVSFIVLTALTFVLILTLNPICLVVLHRASGIQETTKMFMASLTVSDICIGLFWVLPELTQEIAGEWVLGAFLCTVWGVASFSFVTLSVLSLVLLTVDRFVAIVYSLRYPTLMTLKTAKIICAITWILTLTFFILIFGIFLPSTVSTEGPDKCQISACHICGLLRMLLMAISLITIFVLYMYILSIARQQARRIAAQNQIGIAQGDQNAPQRVSTKSATTVFIITMTVLMCWAPSIIKSVATSVLRELQHRNFSMTANLIFFSNSWLNVVIYYLRNRELRQALHDMVASCFHRQIQ